MSSSYPLLTSKVRDVETGLDYFGASYYSSAQGRFTSADEPLIGQDEEDPQTWNLYSYTSGNPLNRIDPVAAGFSTAIVTIPASYSLGTLMANLIGTSFYSPSDKRLFLGFPALGS